MRVWKAAIILAAALLPAMAGTINVTRATEVTLARGNDLLFTISEVAFTENAEQYGLAPYPTRVTFELLSAPQTGSGQFLAELESPDGSVTVDYPGLITWEQGEFQSDGYTGPISALYGSMHLSEALSSELFSSGSAVLELRNEGPAVRVGLPSYRIGQDLTASLSTGGFGIGAVVTRALFDPPDAPGEAPEPGTGMLLGVGAGLSLGARTMKRISH